MTVRRSARPAALATALVATLALAAGLAGCGGDDDALVVYSGRSENLIQPLLDRFSEETGIDVRVKYDDSANLATLIDTEGSSSPADVLISQSPGAVGYLDGADRLETLPASTLELVPARFRSEDGTWVGITGRVRTLLYNTESVSASELPDSVLALTEPRFAGRVGIAPTNGSFQDFVTTMRAVLGDEATQQWLEGMRDNDVRTYESNSAILEAVARGEVEFGLVNHYYNEQAKAENPDTPTENHYFEAGDPGTMILTTAAAVLDTAGDRAADARRLVAFLLTPEAQRAFAEDEFEYPLVTGTEPVVDLPPLEDVVAPDVDLSELGGGLERTREMIRDAGLEQA